jgi:hypothetical protein
MRKMSCPIFNWRGQKAQSLAEVSVFGALLLLVFGFLLRYGLQYSYQQQVKMEAFRQSFKMAGESDLPRSQDVSLIKDVHIPNPQDTFAQGDRNTIRSSASIYRANSSGNAEDAADSDPYGGMSTIKYVFNPDQTFSQAGNTYNQIIGPNNQLIVKEYTTEGLIDIPGLPIAWHNVKLKGDTLPTKVDAASSTKVYQQSDGNGIPNNNPKEVMVLKNAGGRDCNVDYCPTDLLEQVELALNTTSGKYYPVYRVDGVVGSPPIQISLTNDEGGEITTELMNKQTENKVTSRHDQLVLTEGPAERKSQDILDETENVTHVIITNHGDDSPTFSFKNDFPTTWTTQK